jgi:exosortase/archaeosortase family protein
LSCCLLHRAGGWAWVKYFAPPLLFMLIAVPWPMQMEQWTIQSLMRLVAGLTVEIIGFLGIPALQHGNLIEVGAGVVGIDEACSGVRSLQSGLMLSLFLGEMHRFSVRRRMGLVAASLAIVLVANLARTTLLTWTAANRGLEKMAAMHDTAGIVVMVIVLISLVALAHFMKPKSVTMPDVPAPPASPALLPRWVGPALIVWLVLSEVTTEVWYRTHERHLVPSARWVAVWPVHSVNFKKNRLPETSLAILRCSNSDAATWEDDDGNEWSAFFLRWDPGKNSAQLAKGHRPGICFPAAGANLLQDFGQVEEDVHGMKIGFRHQTFQAGSQLLNVFYCLWADRISQAEAKLPEDNSRSSRLQAVLAGKRHLGQQVLEMVVQGPDSPSAAVKSLEAQLPTIVQPGQ